MAKIGKESVLSCWVYSMSDNIRSVDKYRIRACLKSLYLAACFSRNGIGAYRTKSNPAFVSSRWLRKGQAACDLHQCRKAKRLHYVLLSEVCAVWHVAASDGWGNCFRGTWTPVLHSIFLFDLLSFPIRWLPADTFDQLSYVERPM